MSMRILFLALVLATVACGQLRQNRPLSPDRLRTETLKVIADLDRKPDWLFADVVCLDEIMPAKAGKTEYGADGCKDDPARCSERCRTGEPSACYALAALTEKYADEKNDVPGALYRRSCKLGIVLGCTNVAAKIIERNPDDPTSQKCSADTFQKTCDQNDAWGCTMLGLAFTRGEGRPKDNTEALKALKKACEISADKSGPACRNATTLIELISKEKQ